MVSIAHSWLAPGETAATEHLPPPERERSLLRLWTLKEAFLKAVGVGLNADLREVTVGLGDRPELQAAPGEPHPERWLLLPSETPSDTVASLAVVRRGDQSWSPQVVLRRFEL